MIKLIALVCLYLNATFALADGPTYEVEGNPRKFATGLRIPSNWHEKRPGQDFGSLPNLPAKWDWRDKGLTPIKDQGSCGSCWAFSTAATMADAIKLKDGVVKDVSEQFLLSCNKDGYSCGGGWYEHQMHVSPGAVYGSEYPYTARRTFCKPGLPTHEKLVSWAFVESKDGVPSVDKLKSAIYMYGPISVAVAANNAFMAYKSGVFNGCGGFGSRRLNHAVNLVGWDDETKSWIMRNSWGESWGEKGYMKIKYGCNMIGYAASYVDYKGIVAEIDFE